MARRRASQYVAYHDGHVTSRRTGAEYPNYVIGRAAPGEDFCGYITCMFNARFVARWSIVRPGTDPRRNPAAYSWTDACPDDPDCPALVIHDILWLDGDPLDPANFKEYLSEFAPKYRKGVLAARMRMTEILLNSIMKSAIIAIDRFLAAECSGDGDDDEPGVDGPGDGGAPAGGKVFPFRKKDESHAARKDA